MTILKRTAQGTFDWIRGWTPRWVTLILMLFFTLSNFNILDGIETTRQEQRIESRCALRGAFFYLADLADAGAAAAGRPPSQITTEFRHYLDDTYAPLIPDAECAKYLND